MSLPIFKNYKIKLVAFIFAFLIWFFVVTENQYDYIIEVQTVVANIPDGKVILNEIPDKVKIKVTGSGKDLIGLNLGRGGTVELDLTDVGQQKTFVLEPSDVLFSRPAGKVRATWIIMPDSITIFLDSFLQKQLPVTPNVQTKTAAGYTIVGEFVVTPDSVQISGPQSVISQIDSLTTDFLEIADLKLDLLQDISLARLPFNNISIDVQTVELFLDVQKLVEVKKSGIPVEVINAPFDRSVRVVPSTLTLVLEGGGELLTKVTRDDIRAFIDYSRVKNNPANAHVAVIQPPPGITYRDVEPEKFRLVFERKAQ